MRSARRRLGWVCVAACALAEPAESARRQARKAERVLAPPAPYQGSLADARALAKERNVPLVVAAVFEDDGWDPKDHHDQVGLRRDLLQGRVLAEVLQRAVVAVGCNRPHELETIEVASGGAKTQIRRCPSYLTDSCSVHQRLFEDAYATWNQDGELKSPYVVLIAPTGETTILRDDGSTPKAEELQAALDRAQQAAGQGLTSEEHTKVLQLAVAGRSAVQAGKQGSAWRAWSEMGSIAHASRFAEDARQGCEAALAALDSGRGEVLTDLEAGRGVEAYAKLEALAAEWAGTPHARGLAERAHELEQDKQHRASIQAFKREREADAIEGEVAALVANGDKRKASAKLRGLLSRYAECAAAERARQRWPSSRAASDVDSPATRCSDRSFSCLGALSSAPFWRPLSRQQRAPPLRLQASTSAPTSLRRRSSQRSSWRCFAACHYPPAGWGSCCQSWLGAPTSSRRARPLVSVARDSPPRRVFTD